MSHVKITQGAGVHCLNDNEKASTVAIDSGIPGSPPLADDDAGRHPTSDNKTPATPDDDYDDDAASTVVAIDGIPAWESRPPSLITAKTLSSKRVRFFDEEERPSKKHKRSTGQAPKTLTCKPTAANGTLSCRPSELSFFVGNPGSQKTIERLSQDNKALRAKVMRKRRESSALQAEFERMRQEMTELKAALKQKRAENTKLKKKMAGRVGDVGVVTRAQAAARRRRLAQKTC